MSSKNQVFKKVIWKVPNITKEFMTSDDAKKPIYSNKFSVFFGESFTEWGLVLYPAHSITNDIGLFVNLANYSTVNFQLDYRVAIYNRKSNSEVSLSGNKTGQEFAEAGTWGFRSLIKHETFLNKFYDYVTDGSLSAVCKLKITPKPETIKASDIRTSSSNYTDLFQNNFLADFKLVAVKDGVQIESFKCHKLVLARKSLVFKRMFNEGFKEADGGKCEITDLSPRVIQEMLRFIYSEKVEGLDGIAQDLIFAAEKYELKDLKDFCVKNLMKNLNAENVIDVLKISDTIPGADHLFRKCVEVIMDNYQSISQKDDWKTLPQPLLIRTCDLMMKKSGGSSIEFL